MTANEYPAFWDDRWTGLPLQLELIGGRVKAIWRTSHRISFRSSIGTADVEKGWVTDLTSIPWWLFWRRREGYHTAASVLHDELYGRAEVYVHPLREKKPITRKEADQIYLEAMESLGVGPVLRRAIYAGVRAGGWLAWRRYRRREKGKPVSQPEPIADTVNLP